jgi:hypothetical protein
VWFDFRGTKYEKAPVRKRIDLAAAEEIALRAERALYMTAHSVCVAKAFRERKPGHHKSVGTVVTSSRQILAGGQPGHGVSTDATLNMLCRERWGGKTPWEPFWKPLPDLSSAEMLSELDATRSLDLFEDLVKKEGLLLPLDFTVRAEESIRCHDFSQALTLAWTGIELCIDKLWRAAVEIKNATLPADKSRGHLLSDHRTYSAAVRVELLNFAGRLDDRIYNDLSSVRRARNAFLHEQKRVTPEAAMLALRTIAELLRLSFGYDVPVSPSWGYVE